MEIEILKDLKPLNPQGNTIKVTVTVPGVDKDNTKKLDVSNIPPPPPLPNFVYNITTDDCSLFVTRGSYNDGSSMEAMEDSDTDWKSDDDDSFICSKTLRRNRSMNNVHQVWLEKLNEAYTSMKTLCFDEIGSDHRPNIKECWMLYLKEFTEIADGMNCIWERPESTPAKYQNDPSVKKFVNVKILELDIDSMMTFVEPVDQVKVCTIDSEVCDPGSIPDAIPVWQLRPKVESRRPMQFTLECLDLCRFFFEELWFAWDTHDLVKFFEECLEKRIQFLYDVDNDVLSSQEIHVVREMINRSRFIEKRIAKIERLVSMEDYEEGNEEDIMELFQLQLEQEEIGNKIKRLENPVMRLLMKKLELAKVEQEIKKRSDIGETVVLVCKNSTTKELQRMSEVIESKFGQDVNLRIVDSLEIALSSCPPQGTVCISPGTYQISGLKNFEYGGRLLGIPAEDKIIEIEQSEMSSIWLMMDLNVESLLYFENIVFNVVFYDDVENNLEDYQSGCKTHTGILIKEGHLHMNNCTVQGHYFKGDEESHEITHSTMVKLADGGNGTFTSEKSNFQNIKCGYIKHGKKETIVEESFDVDWKILNCSGSHSDADISGASTQTVIFNG